MEMDMRDLPNECYGTLEAFLRKGINTIDLSQSFDMFLLPDPFDDI